MRRAVLAVVDVRVIKGKRCVTVCRYKERIRVRCSTSPRLLGVYTRSQESTSDCGYPTWELRGEGGYACTFFYRADISGQGSAWLLRGPGFEAKAWNVDTPGVPLCGWDCHLDLEAEEARDDRADSMEVGLG